MSVRKTPLYSPSRRSALTAASPPGPAPDTAAAPASRRAAWAKRWAKRRGAAFWASCSAALAAAMVFGAMSLREPAQRVTQAQIDAAVRHSLENEPLPSQAAKASAMVTPSVVRVVALMSDDDDGTDDDRSDGQQRAMERSLGTGVVIKDDGTILTSLHVVLGAKRLRVTFFGGLEADADLVGARPEDDLAVLHARKVPDELVPATMRSTGDLAPGDHVIAIGHPFGIGPSVSYGVVSGLAREFQSPEGKQLLTNLIQFDAAANPGNSGGPLVTMDGNVVGIVTAILNPNEQRTFVGIAFAVPIENAAAAAGMPPF